MGRSSKLSPVRAVMFWNGDYSNPLVRLGMHEYVFKPLKLAFPTNENNYRHAVDVLMDYVMMTTLYFEEHLVRLLDTAKQTQSAMRTLSAKPPGKPFWKMAVKYYTLTVEAMAATKSMSMSQHVASAASFDDIIPNPVMPIDQLAYTESTLRFLHDLSYRLFHENPVFLTRLLVKYMKDATEDARNIHVCNLLYSLVKSHKARFSVNLIVGARPLPPGIMCFGRRNMNVKRVLDLFTVKMCPFCCRPVNVAVKKKSSAGGAHRSQIFTDDYTQEPLYCVEKNHRGIISYPLVSYDGDEFYINELEWTINGGFSRVFTVSQQGGKARMVILNKQTRAILYVPVETDAGQCGDTCLICK